MLVRMSGWLLPLVVVCSLLAAAPAVAAPGALDTRFDGDGIAQVAGTGKLLSVGTTSLLQADGGILVGGARTSIGLDIDDFAFDFRVHPAVTRYRTDGTLDPSYGDHGIAKLYLQNHMSLVTALAQQADGSTIVAGVNVGFLSLTTFVARLDARGQLDTSFGRDGYVTSLPEDLTLLAPLAVHAAPDGSITTAGISFSGDLFGFYDRKRRADVDLVVQRYLSSGEVDRTFGTRGRTNVDTNGADSLDVPIVATFGQDGSLLVGGIAINDALTYGRSLVVRLGADGVLDRSFASNGVAMGPARKWVFDAVTAIGRADDGATYQAVTQISDSDTYDGISGVRVQRTDAHGRPLAFAGGTSVAHVAAAQVVTALAPLADGRVVFAGEGFGDVDDLENPVGIVGRLQTNGRIDMGFDRAGVTRFMPLDGWLRFAAPSGVHAGPDGTILVAGTFAGQAGIARLHGDSAAGSGRRATAVDVAVTHASGGPSCGMRADRPCKLDGRRPGRVQLRVVTKGVPVGAMITVSRDRDEWGDWSTGDSFRVPVRAGGIAVLNMTDVRFDDGYADEDEGDYLDHRIRVDVPATAESISAPTTATFLRVVHPIDRPDSDDDDFDFTRAVACADGASPLQAAARVACGQLDASRSVRGDTRTKVRRWLGR